MGALDAFLPAYQAAFTRYVMAVDEQDGEAALAEATELGKCVTHDGASIDEMRELHRLVTSRLIEDWRHARAGSDKNLALELMARGDAGPFGIAFMLPNEMAQLQAHEQRWRREHGKLLALFEQTADLMLVMDVQGRIESVNPAFCRATGWSQLEAATHVTAMGCGPLPRTATHHLRAQQQRRDGGSFVVEWSISPILDAAGELLSHVCIGRDITREAQMQESLRENEKLRMVATLAAGIAHDFNNLLGSINGLAELCQLQAEPGSRQARNLGRIRQAGDKAAALVRQMLDFSRQSPKAEQRVRASELLAHAQDLLRAALPPHVALGVQVREDAPLNIDLVQMEQVLLNITGNAAQAISPAGGQVQIVVDRAEPASQAASAPGDGGDALDAPPRRHLRVQISDNGCGMPAELLPRIFDPFFTTKPVGQGTGLGLAAVHGIVSSHGGVIEVASQPGQGSSFSIFLPMAEGADDGPQAGADGADDEAAGLAPRCASAHPA
jgi:signal transduction histidine kinase